MMKTMVFSTYGVGANAYPHAKEWVVIGISDGGENLFGFWFVADEVNEERVTSWVLNKGWFRTGLQGQTL